MARTRIKWILVLCMAVVLFCVGTLVSKPTFAWLADTSSSLLKADASIQRSYFESGDGSAEHPFEIAHEIQLYYMSWLQNLGYFNETTTDGSAILKQYYFYLSADLDMDAYVIPPIGTATNPFLGNFDGQGHVVSNVHINNTALTDEPSVADYSSKADQIVGFFGVVGSYNGTLSYTYSTSVNKIQNLCLNNAQIISQTPKDSKTLVGIVAGYVNGTISDVGVNGGSIYAYSGNSTLAALTGNFSDYTVVGYCEAAYLDTTTIVEFDVKRPDLAYSSATSEKTDGNAWGGSVAMQSLYNRLQEIIDRADSDFDYYSDIYRYHFAGYSNLDYEQKSGGANVTADDLGLTGFFSQTIRDAFGSRFFKEYTNGLEGSYTFSKHWASTVENYTYLYSHVRKYENGTMSAPLTYTQNYHDLYFSLQSQKAYYIYEYDGTNYNYLTVNDLDNPTAIANTTDQSKAVKWMVQNGFIYYQVVNEGLTYYTLNATRGVGKDSASLQLGTYEWTSEGISFDGVTNKWQFNTDTEAFQVKDLKYKVGNTEIGEAHDYNLVFDGTNWVLERYAIDMTYYYIKGSEDGTDYYLSKTGTNTITASNNVNNTIVWAYEDNTLVTAVGSETGYLVNHAGNLELVTESTYNANTSTMVNTWTFVNRSEGTYLESTYGGITYALQYTAANGWHLVMENSFRISYGTSSTPYYLYLNTNGTIATSSRGGGSTFTWNFSNASSGGKISAVAGTTVYYLTASGSALTTTTSESGAVSWTVSNHPNISGMYTYTCTSGGSTYYLVCDQGTWKLANANQFVISTYKQSTVHYMKGDRRAGTYGNLIYGTTALEDAALFTATNGANAGKLSTVYNGNVAYLERYMLRVRLVESYSKKENWSSSSKGLRNEEGTTYEIVWTDNGFDLGSNESKGAYLTRPPVNRASVQSGVVSLTEYTNSNTTTSTTTNTMLVPSSFVETSALQYMTPATYTPLNTENVGGVYMPKSVNTGYVVGGSHFQDYENWSAYRLGDVHVSTYTMDNISGSYSGGTIGTVYTVNASDSQQTVTGTDMPKYESSKASLLEMFNADTANVYGIHFMDAQISMSYLIRAQQALIDRVTLYNYQMPESCIDFHLQANGYINFFAGTFFSGNDAFFSLHKIEREKDTLADSAVIAVYEKTSGASTLPAYIFKCADGNFYWYNSATGKTYPQSLAMSGGDTFESCYTQVTTGAYMEHGSTICMLRHTNGNFYVFEANTFTPCTFSGCVKVDDDLNGAKYYSVYNGVPTLLGGASGTVYMDANNITAIRTISKVYSLLVPGTSTPDITKDVIFEYSDGSLSNASASESGGNVVLYKTETKLVNGVALSVDVQYTYSMVFNTAWITDPGTITQNALYYFEIPVNRGEYALGSVDGGTGAYLLYLDISSNGQSVYSTTMTEYSVKYSGTYTYPKGIQVVQADTYADFSALTVNARDSVAIALKTSGKLTLSYDADGNAVVTAANGATYKAVFIGFNIALEDSAGNRIILSQDGTQYTVTQTVVAANPNTGLFDDTATRTPTVNVYTDISSFQDIYDMDNVFIAKTEKQTVTLTTKYTNALSGSSIDLESITVEYIFQNGAAGDSVYLYDEDSKFTYLPGLGVATAYDFSDTDYSAENGVNVFGP